MSDVDNNPPEDRSAAPRDGPPRLAEALLSGRFAAVSRGPAGPGAGRVRASSGFSCESGQVTEHGTIRVFLLDDHEVVRRGVFELLSLEDDIDVVGEAGTAAEALVRIPATRPQVAVLDVRLPDGSGVEVCREIRSTMPDVRCLMLTSFSDDEALFDAIMAGAAGYVLKDIRGSDLVGAVRDVAAGKSLLDPVATARVLERLRGGGKQDDRLASLSEQERKILDLIGEGMTNRQIGGELHLAEKTVKNYVSSLLAKLGMERRTQAAAYVARTKAENRR
ncbi:response regulator transcription factor [Yinghuangia aomiensis]|uniref:Response regulator transcription factor n=1 Tax=Yinghuangia aomiensis TaxID=676205 RepID=A0ABP9GSC4_9ACTN